MKAQISILMGLLGFLLLFVSCDNKDDNFVDPPIENVGIEIKISYVKKENNKEYADANSLVFVYYDIGDITLQEYTYEGDGVFTKKDSKVVSEEKHKTGADGTVSFMPKYLDKNITLVTISNYTNKISVSSFLSHGKYPIKQTIVYNL